MAGPHRPVYSVVGLDDKSRDARPVRYPGFAQPAMAKLFAVRPIQHVIVSLDLNMPAKAKGCPGRRSRFGGACRAPAPARPPAAVLKAPRGGRELPGGTSTVTPPAPRGGRYSRCV